MNKMPDFSEKKNIESQNGVTHSDSTRYCATYNSSKRNKAFVYITDSKKFCNAVI